MEDPEITPDILDRIKAFDTFVDGLFTGEIVCIKGDFYYSTKYTGIKPKIPYNSSLSNHLYGRMILSMFQLDDIYSFMIRRSTESLASPKSATLSYFSFKNLELDIPLPNNLLILELQYAMSWMIKKDDYLLEIYKGILQFRPRKDVLQRLISHFVYNDSYIMGIKVDMIRMTIYENINSSIVKNQFEIQTDTFLSEIEKLVNLTTPLLKIVKVLNNKRKLDQVDNPEVQENTKKSKVIELLPNSIVQ
jgi:hypothetical protein